MKETSDREKIPKGKYCDFVGNASVKQYTCKYLDTEFLECKEYNTYLKFDEDCLLKCPACLKERV